MRCGDARCVPAGVEEILRRGDGEDAESQRGMSMVSPRILGGHAAACPYQTWPLGVARLHERRFESGGGLP